MLPFYPVQSILFFSGLSESFPVCSNRFYSVVISFSVCYWNGQAEGRLMSVILSLATIISIIAQSSQPRRVVVSPVKDTVPDGSALSLDLRTCCWASDGFSPNLSRAWTHTHIPRSICDIKHFTHTHGNKHSAIECSRRASLICILARDEHQRMNVGFLFSLAEKNFSTP